MTTLIESAKSGVGKLFCDALRGGANFAGLFPSGLGAATISEALIGAYGNVCSGDPNNLPTVAPAPAFSGGQCAGVPYSTTVSFSYRSRSDGSTRTQTRTLSVIGKISSITLNNVATGSGTQIQVVHSGGTSVAGTINTEPNSAVITSITNVRADGNPDTCGDPEPDIPAVEDVSDSFDIDYDSPNPAYDPSQPISPTNQPTIPINLPDLPIKFFKPCINLDGIRIPFEIDTPFGKLCGKIGLQPDIKTVGEPSIDIDLCPSQKEDLGLNTPELEDYFDVSSPIGTSVASEFDGVLNDGFNLDQLPIMGVFVNSQYVDKPFSQTVLDQLGTKPNLIVPNIGYVIFEYLIQTGETTYESAFSSEIPIKVTNQFVPCPYPFGAVGVQVRWSSNWQGNYRLAKRKSCCSACSEGSAQDIVDKLDRCRLD